MKNHSPTNLRSRTRAKMMNFYADLKANSKKNERIKTKFIRRVERYEIFNFYRLSLRCCLSDEIKVAKQAKLVDTVSISQQKQFSKAPAGTHIYNIMPS